MIIVCVLFPAIAVVLLGYRKLSCKEYLSRVLIYVLLSNVVVYAFYGIIYGTLAVVIYIKQYISFAIKYFILSLGINIGIYFFDRCVIHHEKLKQIIPAKAIAIMEKCGLVFASEKIFFAVVVIIAIANGVFLVDNAVWGDEAFSGVLIRNDVGGILEGTAGDVHPPLYYLILKLAVSVFGESGTVLHMVSYIAFLGVCILIATCIRKCFGVASAYFSILLVGWTGIGMVYSVEIRMYSFAMLFVTATFCFGYMALKTEKQRFWVAMSICALMAAYTHYFALIEVAFMLLGVFITALAKRQAKAWSKIGISMLICVVGYLPWLFTLVLTVERTVGGFWLKVVPPFKECMELVLGRMAYSYRLFQLILVLILFYVIERMVAYIKDKKKQIADKDAGSTDDEWMAMIWIAFVTIIVTTVFGIVFSKMVRPVMLTRYLIPMIVLAAVVVGGLLEHFRKKKYLREVVYLVEMLCIVFMMISGMKEYQYRYEKYVVSRDGTQQTLEVLDQYIEEGYLLVSDIDHFNWTIMEYYYPQKHIAIGEMKDNEEISKGFIGLMGNELNADEIKDYEYAGYSVQVIDEGRIDNTELYLYHIGKK